MAEAQGRVRISLSFDTSGADRGVKSVTEAFRRLGESAKRALSGTTMDGVQNSAKNTTDAIRGIRDEMDDMSGAEAKAAAALAKQLAVVDSLVAQIAATESKTETTLAGLAAQQKTLEDNIHKSTAAANELQAEWDRIDRSINRDRTTGEILPGQDKKIAQLDKLGAKMADLDAKTRNYQARLDTLKARIQSVNETKLGEGGIKSALQAKLEAAEAQADALRQKLTEVQQAKNTALGGAIGKAGGMAANIGNALGSGLKRAGATAKNVFGAIPGYAKRSFAKISRMGAPVTRLFERVGRSARQVFAVGAMLSLLRGARDILSGIVNQDAKISGQLSTIKGNLLAAFRPLWEKVYPAVTAILNVLVAITSAIANLSAKLFGGAVSSTAALYGEAEAIGAVGGAAASASKELGAFDEINKVDDSKGGGSGGGGGGKPTGGLLTDLSWTMQDIYDKLMAINWELVAGRINDALLGIDFVAIGNGLREGIEYIESTLSTLITGIDWEQLGRNIGSGMNALLSGDVLPNLAGLLADWFNAKVKLFYGFVTTFDWKGLGHSIAASINRFVKTMKWGEAGRAFNDFGLGVLDMILEALEGTNWEAIGQGIADFIKGIKWDKWKAKIKKIIWEALTGLGTIIVKITSVLFNDGGIDSGETVSTFDAAMTGILAIAGFAFGGIAGGIAGIAIATGVSMLIKTISASDPGGWNFDNMLESLAIILSGILGLAIVLGGAGTAILTISLPVAALLSVVSSDWTTNTIANPAAMEERLRQEGVIREVTPATRIAFMLEDPKILEYDESVFAEVMEPIGLSLDSLNNKADHTIETFNQFAVEIQEAYAIFAETGNIDTFRKTLIGLGLDAELVESVISLLSNKTADIESNTAGAAEAVTDISDSMSGAAESAQDMADSTETVAGNSADAEKAVKSEAKTLAKAESDIDDAATASEELGTATGDMADATSDGVITMDAALQNNLSGWQRYATTLTGIMAGITAQQTTFWTQMSGSATETANSIKDSFTALGTHMTSTISGAWRSVISALSKGGSSFEAITGGINTVIRSALNGVITGLNNVFRSTFSQLNNVLGQLRGTRVGGVLPFGAIRTITIPQIPRLAQGAVIPANHEFLAVLGDQKRGTNVEAPLDTITDAMMAALQRTGMTGASPEAIAAAVRSALTDMAVQFDREQVGRIVARTIDDNRRVDGKFAYDLA